MRNNTGLVILLIVVIVSAFLLMIVKLAEVFSSGSHRAKRVRERGRGDGLFHLLAPSAVGMVVCAVCLCGASWAWFTASASTDVAGMQFARFAVSVAVKQEGTDVTDDAVTYEDGTYSVSLDADAAYTITITPTADSTTSGYCKVEYDDGRVAYTDQITPDSTAGSFTVTGTGKLTITPEWGAPPEGGDTIALMPVTDDPADEEDLPQDTIAPPQDEDNAPDGDTTTDNNTPGDSTPGDAGGTSQDGSTSGEADGGTAGDHASDGSTTDGNTPDNNAGTALAGDTPAAGTLQDAAGEAAPTAADESADGQA